MSLAIAPTVQTLPADLTFQTLMTMGLSESPMAL